MQILMLFGHRNPRDTFLRDAQVSERTQITLAKPQIVGEEGDRIDLRVANTKDDLETLRGNRYDVILYDDSYRSFPGSENIRAMFIK